MRRIEIPFETTVTCGLREAGPGAPLIVAIHGQGESHLVMEERVGERGPDFTWAFPRAPYPAEHRRRDEIRVGYSWYQYTGDPADFRESLRVTGSWLLGAIDTILAETGADASRVFLLGFSQGGYLAGSVAFTWPERFAGVALLGARYKTELLEDGYDAVRGLTCFSGHGTRDRAVKVEPSRERVEEMRAAGLTVEHREYACGHRVLPEMVDDALAAFRVAT